MRLLLGPRATKAFVARENAALAGLAVAPPAVGWWLIPARRPQ